MIGPQSITGHVAIAEALCVCARAHTREYACLHACVCTTHTHKNHTHVHDLDDSRVSKKGKISGRETEMETEKETEEK